MEISASELVSLLNWNTRTAVKETLKQFTLTLKSGTSQTKEYEMSLPETDIDCCAGKTSIGENIKQIRTRSGMTQVELAEAVNISQPMLNQIERGTKTISLPLADSVAEELHCSLYDIIGKENRYGRNENGLAQTRL